MKITQKEIEKIVKQLEKKVGYLNGWFLTGSCAMTDELKEGSDVDIVINKMIDLRLVEDIMIAEDCRPVRKGYDQKDASDYFRAPLYVNIDGVKVNIIQIPDVSEFAKWKTATKVCRYLALNFPTFMDNKSVRVTIFDIIRGKPRVEVSTIKEQNRIFENCL